MKTSKILFTFIRFNQSLNCNLVHFVNLIEELLFVPAVTLPPILIYFLYIILVFYIIRDLFLIIFKLRSIILLEDFADLLDVIVSYLLSFIWNFVWIHQFYLMGLDCVEISRFYVSAFHFIWLQ